MSMSIPQRTCIGCHQVKAKSELIRIVKSDDGEVIIDLFGKEKGRGAYVCRNADCINKAMRPERLNRAFRIGSDSTSSISREAANRSKQKLLSLWAG